MPFRSSLKLDSPFFDGGARKKAFGVAAYASAQSFRRKLQQKMEDSTPAGRVVSIGENEGFDTRFRRSRRGQRPAIQTRRLLNSIYAFKNGDLSARTEVTAVSDEGEKYGETLQNILGREVMTDEDILEAEKFYFERSKQALINLL